MKIPENTSKEMADWHYNIVDKINSNTNPGLVYRQCDFDSMSEPNKVVFKAWAKEKGFNI